MGWVGDPNRQTMLAAIPQLQKISICDNGSNEKNSAMQHRGTVTMYPSAQSGRVVYYAALRSMYLYQVVYC